LKGLKQDKSPYKEYVNQTVPTLENIAEYYKKVDGMTKKRILGCIFSKKLVLKKEELQLLSSQL
jgi:site-specific DNA recombinase